MIAPPASPTDRSSHPRVAAVLHAAKSPTPDKRAAALSRVAGEVTRRLWRLFAVHPSGCLPLPPPAATLTNLDEIFPVSAARLSPPRLFAVGIRDATAPPGTP